MATNQKILQTRIKLKYDSYENWTENNPILLAGELAAVYVAAKPTKEVNSISAPQILFKVGDGQVSSTGEITGTAFNSLPWASGLAADVYEWAKTTLPPVASITGNNGAKATKDGKNAYTVSADLADYTKNAAAASKGTGSKIYAVELDKNGHLMVAVPWTDTDTVYTGDDPIVVDASTKTISHAKKGPSETFITGASTATIKGSGAKGTIKIPNIIVDTWGHADVNQENQVDIELPTVGSGNLTIKVGSDGSTSGTGTFSANATADKTITLPVYTKDEVYTKGEVDTKMVGAVEYLGTVGNLTELNAKTPKHKGDFVRVSIKNAAPEWKYNEETLHSGDLLICETIKSGDTAATWSVIHGEIDKYTWVANSINADGYVAKTNGVSDQVWKTDINGTPGWREDEGVKAIAGKVTSTGKDTEFNPEKVFFLQEPSDEIQSYVEYLDSYKTLKISYSLSRKVDTKSSTFGSPDNLATVGSIEREIEKLDYTDAEQANYYVSKVSQTDGVIAVERKKLPDAIAPNSGKLTDRAGTEIFNANQSDDSQIMIIDCGTSSTVL